MRLFFVCCLTIVLFFGAANSMNAQGKYGKIGKVMTVEEGNKLFGDVIEKQTINTAYLKKVAKKAKHYVKIKLKNKYLTILEDTIDEAEFNKKFADNAIMTDDSPQHVFSVETIEELIELGGSETTTIENRSGVLTVTNGAYLMEFASGCPPYCG